jgi:hypothetical protein
MSVATFDRHTVAGRAAIEAKAAKIIAIAENRRRLRRIKEALARIEADLEDGRQRKHGYFGDTREERGLAEIANIWADLDQLEVR